MIQIKESLLQIKDAFEGQLNNVKTSSEAEAIRVRFLGKKGELTAVLRGMGTLSAEERPVVGQIANDVRSDMESKLQGVIHRIEAEENDRTLVEQKIDITLPGNAPPMGGRHPLYKVIDEICDIFMNLGYSIAEGPEIEFDSYAFERLRLPEGHPARDEQDTFYITDKILLRPQTSPVQVRVMEKTQPPIKIVCPGKVYRSDALDSTHSPIFHQIEGLFVDQHVTMGDLIGSLRLFARKLFGEDTKIRLRPHHFPFTEPSCEVDISCWGCGGTGCRICKNEGWIEVLGAGMVHPEVLKMSGIDPEIYSGFAFGIGVERTAMGRYGIEDIRLLFENDLRFLRQFR
ncbi:MAG: phenylalanine--tRNA ligase subunit alpha [Oscillospiraceae bacterium]|nr:phenylalanine--tRNA ligase subunit alpha [Oscillospiraceae bacterium]